MSVPIQTMRQDVSSFVAPVPGAVAVAIHSLSVAEVCGLIDAAGPLRIEDVAAGLSVSLRETSAVVDWLLGNGDLRLDEWGRLTLAGACRKAA